MSLVFPASLNSTVQFGGVLHEQLLLEAEEVTPIVICSRQSCRRRIRLASLTVAESCGELAPRKGNKKHVLLEYLQYQMTVFCKRERTPRQGLFVPKILSFVTLGTRAVPVVQ